MKDEDYDCLIKGKKKCENLPMSAVNKGANTKHPTPTPADDNGKVILIYLLECSATITTAGI